MNDMDNGGIENCILANFPTISSGACWAWRGASIDAAVIGACTVMVGAGRAVVRAALPGGLALPAGSGVGRVAPTAWGIVFVYPLLHSASFQLCFTTTLGLAL